MKWEREAGTRCSVLKAKIESLGFSLNAVGRHYFVYSGE